MTSNGGLLWKKMSLLRNFGKQCDQIGQFLKVHGNKFAYKSSPKTLVTFWAFLKRITLCKNCCDINLGNFRKHLGNFRKHLGNIFTPISGHTGNKEEI